MRKKTKVLMIVSIMGFLNIMFLFSTLTIGKQIEMPSFQSDGSIIFRNKKLIVHQNSFVDIILDSQEVFKLYQEFSLKDTNWITPASSRQISDKKFVVNEKEKSSIFTCSINNKDKTARILFRQEIKLRPDGLISVITDYKAKPEKSDIFRWSTLFMGAPFEFLEGKNAIVDGKKIAFSRKNSARNKKTRHLFRGQPKKLKLFKGIPSKTLFIKLVKAGLYLREKRLINPNLPDSVGIGFIPNNGKIELLIDLRGEAENAKAIVKKDTHFNIDYWNSGKLHVPNFSFNRNLLTNPSFESGLRYYQYAPWGSFVRSEKDKKFYSIDASQAKFGNCSLRMPAIKGIDHPLGIRTFLIPTISGKKYTFSFYTKGDKPKGLSLYLNVFSALHSQWPVLGECKVSDKWQRHSYSFTAPNRGATISIKPRYKGSDVSEKGHIWLDGLQLEQGEMTDYVEKPLYSFLKTSNKYNFFSPGEKVNAHLIVTSKPHSQVKANIKLISFYGKILWEKKLNFKTNEKGQANIELPFESEIQSGSLQVEANFELPNGYRESDFYKITVMNPLMGTHKLKNLCGATFNDSAHQRDAFLYFWRSIGIGAVSNPENKSLLKELNDYNINVVNSNIVTWWHNISIKVNGEFKLKNIAALKEVTPEYLKKLEQVVYEKVKSQPSIKQWVFLSEPDGNLHQLKRKDLAKLYNAACRGMKRANPNLQHSTPGPANMMPRGGTAWLDAFLTDCPEIFDVVAIHPYRQTPEEPDLDDDTVRFLNMLKKHDMDKTDIYWNEGIYHVPYIIPEYGLNSLMMNTCSQDRYMGGTISYHMGWGEKICAAYYARSILVAMKYSNRIKYYNGWNKSVVQDLDFSLFAVAKVYNTLGNLLGNAVFKKDIRFAPKIRCYVFEDEKKRPVAAIWSHIKKVDRGEKAAPYANILFKQTPEIFDLMENKLNPDRDLAGKLRVLVSPFPIFIRGKVGTFKDFCDALAGARLENQKVSPLHVSVMLADGRNSLLTCRNIVTQPFKGKIKLKDSITKFTHKLNLASRSSIGFKIPLTETLSYNKIDQIKLNILVKENNGEKMEKDVSYNAFAIKKKMSERIIKIDADPSDWKNVPVIEIKNQIIYKIPPKWKLKYKSGMAIGGKDDFSAVFSAMWDDDNFYLLVKVKDDKFFHEKKRVIGGHWQNDSLQVYFDTMCDARVKSFKGFDANDYNYDFFPWQGKLIAYRRFAAERQLSAYLEPNSIEKNIKTAFAKTQDGYIYEIMIPSRYLMPMEFKTGNKIGFGIFINDNDGEFVKRGLTLTPNGTGCYRKPHLYPTMLLTE